MNKYIITGSRKEAENIYGAVKINGQVVMGSYKKVKKVLDMLNKGIIRFPHYKMMKIENNSNIKVITDEIGVVDLE
jgi:hypothetical protein